MDARYTISQPSARRRRPSRCREVRRCHGWPFIHTGQAGEDVTLTLTLTLTLLLSLAVRSLGTEGRKGDPSLEILASDTVYECVQMASGLLLLPGTASPLQADRPQCLDG